MSQLAQSEEGGLSYRILYCDSDPDFGAFLQERLRSEDDRLDLEPTDSIDDVLAAMDRCADCILIGSGIERTDPVSLLELIRDRNSEIPVVLFPAGGTESLASEAISAGATDYVVRASESEQYGVLADRLATVVEEYHTEQQAQAATDRLERVYERIEDAFYAVDDEWRVTYWNEQMTERTGVPASAIVGDVVWDHFPDMVGSDLYECYHEAMETQEPRSFEMYLEPLGYWIEVRVFPDESGLSIYSKDISERKTREQRLRDLKDRLDLAINGANLGVWDWNVETGGVTFNEQWAAMLGDELDAIDQSLETWRDRIHPEDVEVVEDAIHAHFAGETERFDCEHRIETSSGDWKWIRDLGEVVERDDEGNPRRAVGIAIDITEQKRTRQQVEESRQRLRQIIDLLPQLVFAKSETGEYLFANEALASAYGTTVDEIEGSTDAELANSAAEAEQYRADDQAVLESGEPLHIPEEEITYPDGETHVLETRKIPFDPVESAGEAVLGVSADITRLKETERDLKRFREAVEAAGHAIFITDTEGTIQYVNPAFEELTGYTRDEAIGETPRILESGEHSEDYFQRLWETLLAGEVWEEEIENHRRSGDPYYADQTITPIQSDDGDIEAFVAIQRDITRRKRLEERLRALHQADQELTVAESLEEVAKTAIKAAEEVLQLPISCVWRHDDSEDALVPITASERALEIVGNPPTFEHDDSIAWDVFETGEMRVFEDVRDADTVYNESTPLRSEMLAPLGDQGVMCVSSTEVGAFSDLDVDLLQILASGVEAAMKQARRERQLRERERELARQNERLDEFTSVVAHDLRNPLSIAIGMLDVARETGEEEHFEKATDALFRMEELIEDLLTLARQGGTIEETDAVEMASKARESWRYVSTAKAELQIDTAPGATIDANADRLAQLFENLFRNAIEHGGEGVTVRVGTLDDGFFVEDCGPGIPEDERDCVFEHGYTTAEDGTGLGLSIVDEIARAHGWDVTNTEGTDGGARFEFLSTADRQEES